MTVLWYFVLIFLPSSLVVGQTYVYYTAYRSSFPFVTSCPSGQYYDIALLQCSACPTNTNQSASDPTQCDCPSTSYYYAVNQGGGSLICQPCGANYVQSSDKFGCVASGLTCNVATLENVVAESQLTGAFFTGTGTDNQPRLGDSSCVACLNGSLAAQTSQRCSPCAASTPYTSTPTGTITCCDATTITDGICLSYVRPATGISPTFSYLNRYTSPSESKFFRERLETSLYLCRMNLNAANAQSSSRLLLVNATACHVLANIAAMQFYCPGNGYAYTLYDTYIWQSTSQQIWTSNLARPSIPFLAYPSTYYSEINNASYNWIPAVFQQQNIIRIKLAKYSATGQYIGLFDAVDSYLLLCGRSYTDGQPAFTFGTNYNRTCSIRVDTLWNSSIFETAFYDPYIVFTQSGTDQMIPIPVVIKNYQTSTSSPNQNDDQSQWVYHRRFFLLDRLSGVSTSGELKSIHYAQSITIFNRLTSGTSYMQPPVIIIEYAELTQSDLGQGSTVQITLQTEYQMDLSNHIRDIWIAIGVLSGLGILLAFAQTRIWYSRAGKQVIDLATIGKLFLCLCNIIATVFFIVMTGVSMWWLIFFKRYDFVYFVIPTSAQQTTFTVLVVVAFVLKTLDILQLIIRQGNIDIFFVDWEKTKTGDSNRVSIWRSCFIANEFNELQTFRRVDLTFQLIFLLLLLKVINLENIAAAQPGIILFPTTADYQADYNGILRVGIAFSMWLATGLIQYLGYVIFYQRLVENRLVNFIDLCSVSNVSVFILQNNQYGYYIHGRSPHGVADVNMKEMLMHLERESDQLIGGRGLEPNSDDQTFVIKVSRAFRTQFDILLNNYRHRILNRMSKKEEEHESEILMASYRNLNEFLCAFITRSLPNYNYNIRRRFLCERIFNREFLKAALSDSTDSTFFADPDRNVARVLFLGHENSLFMWNMATFLLVDYFAFNYVLAAIITYILNLIAIKLRESLGRSNISKKTLIAKEFLI